jgi:uncharacterized damage-inducible protein DinB
MITLEKGLVAAHLGSGRMTRVDDHKRTEPPRVADERVSLTGFLEYQRQTLAMKCSGLTPEQLREKAVPPSAMSLLGLVRHLADVERSWFQNVMNGEHVRSYWGRRPDGEPAEFDVDEADPGEAFEIWSMACARSRDIVDAAESLEVVGHYGEEEFSLRYVLTHMIEEYARHNGHADLLRERIDGATGE